MVVKVDINMRKEKIEKRIAFAWFCEILHQAIPFLALFSTPWDLVGPGATVVDSYSPVNQ